MSIHPEFAEAIMSGSKRVEFRRGTFAKEVATVVVYATQPTGRVVGYFEVDGIEVASPTAVWEEYREVGGISRRRFRDYFKGSRRAMAIRVGRVTELQAPRRLEDIFDDIVVPQSFTYLTDEKFARLLA